MKYITYMHVYKYSASHTHTLLLLPGEYPDTDEILYVPETDQCVGTTRSEVLARRVHLYTDTVSRVGVQTVRHLQVGVTENNITYNIF
jgi:hypothetical protein